MEKSLSPRNNVKIRIPILFGSCVSFSPTNIEDEGFITSSGPADSRLYLRRGMELPSLIGFESNVFQIINPMHLEPNNSRSHSKLHKEALLSFNNAINEDVVSPNFLRSPMAEKKHMSLRGNNNNYNNNNLLDKNIMSNGLNADLTLTNQQVVTYGSRFSLLHKQSGMLVALLSTQPSSINNDCFVISLVPPSESSSSAHFKFVPRYKIHSDGDTVCSSDQVVIQLFSKSIFMHLSISTVTDNSNIDDSVSRLMQPNGMSITCGNDLKIDEINGSEIPSVWCVLRYDIGAEDPVFLRATVRSGRAGVATGIPLALFHREKEMVIMTEDTLKAHASYIVDGYTTPLFPEKTNSPTSGKTMRLPGEMGSSLISPRTSSTMRVNQQIRKRDSSYQRKINDSSTMPSSSQLLTLCPVQSIVEDFSFSTLQCRCTALWIFERANPIVGGPITTKERYRIRQAATNRFLSVTYVASEEKENLAALAKTENLAFSKLNFEMTRSRSRDTDETKEPMLILTGPPTTEEELSRSIFTIHMILDQESMFVSQNDFLLLRHYDSGYWIGTATTKNDEHYISLLPQPHTRDALLAGHVHAGLQHSVLHLFRFSEMLQKCRDYFASAQFDNSNSVYVQNILRTATDSLIALIFFCTESENDNPLEREGLPIFHHQQMLFDLGMHKLVFEVISAPFTGQINHLPCIPLQGGAYTLRRLKLPEYEGLFELLRLCFRLLKQMIKEAPHLGILLCDYIPLLYAFDGLKLHVADTMIEFFTGNCFLPRELKLSSINHYINLVCGKARTGGYLRILSALAADKEFKSFVCHRLLVENERKLLKMVMVKDVVCVDTGQGQVPLPDFLLNYPDSRQVKYFESQIELYRQISKDSIPFCINTLRPLLTQESCSWILSNLLWQENDSSYSFNKLDTTRAWLIDLVLNIYVLPDLCLTEIQLKTNVPLLPSSKLRHQNRKHSGIDDSSLVSILKDVCIKILKQNPYQVIENRRRNILLKACVNSWKRLIQFWQYSENELDVVIPMMISTLDSSNDRKTIKYSEEDSTNWNRHLTTEEGNVALLVKENAVEVLQTMLDHSIHVESNKLIITLTLDEIHHSDEIVELINNACCGIVMKFNAQRLLPILLDVARYDMASLSSKTLDFIARLGHIRGLMFEKVMSLPHTRDKTITTFFDDSFEVAENVLRLVDMRLNSESERLTSINNKTHISKMKQKNSNSSISTNNNAMMNELSITNNSFDNQGKIAAENERLKIAIGRLIDLMEKGCPKDLSHNLGAKLIRHWGVHLTLIRLLQIIPITDHLFPLVVRFFYFFAQEGENAVQLLPYMDVFLSGITHFSAHNDCLGVIIAVMTSSTYLQRDIDISLVKRISEMIEKESKLEVPDPSLVQMLNKSCASDVLSNNFLSQLIDSLHQEKVFDDVAHALSTWRSAKLSFIGCLLILLTHHANNSTQSRNAVNKIVSPSTILKVLIKTRNSQKPLPLYVQGCYFQLLTALWNFEDISHYEMHRLRTQWTNCTDWWIILISVTEELYLIVHGDDENNNKSHEKQQKQQKHVLENISADKFLYHFVFPTITMFFKNCFLVSLVGRKQEFGVTTRNFCISLSDYIQHESNAIVNRVDNTFELTSILISTCEQLDMKNVAMTLKELQKILQLRHVVRNEVQEHSDDDNDNNQIKLPESITGCCVKMDPLLSFVRLLQCAGKSKSPAEDDFIEKALCHLKLGDLSVDTTVSLIKLFTHVLKDTESEQEMILIQEHLDNLGTMRVVTTLTESRNDLVVDAAFNLGIALLEGGNTLVQNRMLEYFDTHDEKFFLNVKDILERCRLTVFDFLKRNGVKKIQNSDAVNNVISLTVACFRFVQLLCEGHHLGMQNYIRDQHDNLHSINVVFEVAQLMKELCGTPAVKLLPVLVGGFALMTEVCQGPCPANQTALMNHGVCTMIVQAFTMKIPETDSNELIIEEIQLLRSRATTTLLAILEGCTDAYIVTGVLQQVPPSVVVALLSSVISTCNQEDMVNQLENDDASETVFNLLIYLIQVRPYADADSAGEIDSILTEYSSLSKFLGAVEIQREDRLENLFFRIPRLCMSLTTQSKNQLLMTVDRSSRSTKLADFVHQADEIIFEMNLTHRMEQFVNRRLRFEIEKDKQNENVINTDNNDNKTFKFSEIKKTTFFKKNNFDIITLKRMWNYLSFVIVTHKIEYYEILSLIIAVMVNCLFTIFNVDGIHQFALNLFGVIQVYLTTAIFILDSAILLPSYLYRMEKRRVRDKANLANNEKKSTFLSISTRITTLFRAYMFLVAILGLFYNPLFYAGHLVGLIHQSSVLMNVIVAITQNGRSLILTMGLGVVMVYLFAIIGYQNYPKSFGSRGNEENDNLTNEHEPNCATLARCFAFILVQGLRQGGGVGDVMKEALWSEKGIFWRMSYDFLFFALLNVVFLNILFGIIIDAFAELRDDKRKKEEDMNGNCYICGTEAEIFEKHGIGFSWHVRKEHNMWQYLYLMHHLRNKDPNEYTGQESYVATLLAKGSLAFFPEQTSLSLHAKKAAIMQPIIAKKEQENYELENDTSNGGNNGNSKSEENKLVAALRGLNIEVLNSMGGDLHDLLTELNNLRAEKTESAAVGTVLRELASTHRLCEKLHTALQLSNSENAMLRNEIHKHEATIKALTHFIQSEIPIVWHEVLREVVDSHPECKNKNGDEP